MRSRSRRSYIIGFAERIVARAPVTALLQAGCYELFAHDGFHAIADLKGRSVGTLAPPLISMVAAWVGLDPQRDLRFVSDSIVNPFPT